MGHFELELQEEKSHLIGFGRFAQENAAKKGEKAYLLDHAILGNNAFINVVEMQTS